MSGHGDEANRESLSWLHLLMLGQVGVGEEAGRVALAAGWATRTRRRDTVECVRDRIPQIEARLDRTWPRWRTAQAALLRAGLPPTVRGWQDLRDLARQAAHGPLPPMLNGHTVAAWLRGNSKAGLQNVSAAALGTTLVTHDNVLRLRPQAGLVLERAGQTQSGDALVAFTHEIVIPERAFLTGLRLSGTVPKRLLLIENLGVYVDFPLPPTWCAAWVPGWNLAMVQTLRGQWPNVSAVLFGDLDPNGVEIAESCRSAWPELMWFVPEWRPDLLDASQPKVWPKLRPGAPETIRRLAEAGRWVEQEQLLRRPGLVAEIERFWAADDVTTTPVPIGSTEPCSGRPRKA